LAKISRLLSPNSRPPVADPLRAVFLPSGRVSPCPAFTVFSDPFSSIQTSRKPGHAGLFFCDMTERFRHYVSRAQRGAFWCRFRPTFPVTGFRFVERDNAATSGSLSPSRHVRSFRAGAFTSRKRGVILSRPGGEVGRYAYRSSLRNWQYRGNGSDDVALFPFATVSRYGRLRRPRISALVFYHTVCTPCRLAAQDELPSIYQ
jgi:hypothetical protein